MNCPKDLNSFLLSEPLFENTFPDDECEEKKFYGDCFHCFATSIRKRDKQLINSILDKIKTELERRGGNDEKAFCKSLNESYKLGLREAIEVINKYREGENK